jgi:5'-3' exonuclease
MTGVPLLLVDGHNLLFRACFGTPAQIWSRHSLDKRDLTTEFMFFALLRKGINSELPGWPDVIVVFDVIAIPTDAQHALPIGVRLTIGNDLPELPIPAETVS